MPETLTIIYLVYMFIALYFMVLFSLTFFQNRKDFFFYPEPIKNYSVSFLIPAFNREQYLEATVNNILNSDYKNIVEIIIIDDGSTDNTLKIARELERKHDKIRVLTKKNEGTKGGALNYAIPYAKGELVGVVDADSYPAENAVSTMVGFFNEEKVGAVTTVILVKNRNNFLGQMQAIEYKVIAFTRKLLGFLDSIYVTPGPMALYRKTALQKIGGFDKKNMTEDIEATWHLLHDGYDIKMSFASRNTTSAPETLRKWYRQRIRWNIGGYQTMVKYRKDFFKKGMLGLFILPFFSISLLLGVFGLGVFFYRIFTRFLTSYLSTKYSIEAQTAILRLDNINLNPSVLNFLGIVLFILGMIFVYLALRYVNLKTNLKERENFFGVIFYSVIYIMLRPLVLIISLYKYLRGNYSWD